MPNPFPWLNPFYMTPVAFSDDTEMVRMEYNFVSYASVVSNRATFDYYRGSTTSIILEPDAESVSAGEIPYFDEDVIEVVIWNKTTSGGITEDESFSFTVLNGGLTVDPVTNKIIVNVTSSENWGLIGNCVIQLVEHGTSERVFMEHRLRMYPSVIP